ncbi:MAG: hypothetical protein KAR11_05790 [Phycisphaerae bacterium]|nr:hypothetical protein [Phycisphaerae bacterium]
MNELLNISILAEGGSGVVEVLFFVAVAVLGIVGSVVSSIKKKREEQQEQERLQALRDEAKLQNSENEDDWMVIEQEPIPVPPPPVRSQKAAISDFIKPERRRLVPDQPEHNPQPIPIPIPKPMQLQSSGMEKLRPPKVVHNRAAAKRGRSRLVAPREHSDVHRTVPCDGALEPLTGAVKTTVQLNAAAARQAMIYHEIFSQPKALRDLHELWD